MRDEDRFVDTTAVIGGTWMLFSRVNFNRELNRNDLSVAGISRRFVQISRRIICRSFDHPSATQNIRPPTHNWQEDPTRVGIALVVLVMWLATWLGW